jgi:hypothetical protein
VTSRSAKADKPVLLRLPISVIHRMRGALFEDDEDLSDEAVDDEMGN